MPRAVADMNSWLRKPAAPPSLWRLDPKIVFLNHGSFGACPRAVLRRQSEFRERLEEEPVRFMLRELEPLVDAVRSVLARFTGAPASDIAFVPNATSGVNTVLRSLSARAGDEWLVTDHEYNACRNALDFAASRGGAKVVVARVPFPLASEDQVVEAILEKATPRTRLALIDHVTSQTGLVLPIARLVRELETRGIRTLVDGAHAPGMVPLKLKKLGASFYTGNCHKWICAPKGAAFLYVRPDCQSEVRPLTISHGANSPRTDRSRFLLEFGWTGTADPSAILSVPAALEFMGKLLDGGWPALMKRNRELALAAQAVLCQALEIAIPCPSSMIGSLAAFPLPLPRRSRRGRPTGGRTAGAPAGIDELQDRLFFESKIEVPVNPWPKLPERLLRVSAQAYNSLPQYERLAEALKRHLAG